jgi:class 3 adenylate cyclase/tetratricopeptide (TPR) repeat protein
MTRLQRKIAAIMFSDIFGYSRLMSEGEEQTLALLQEHNAIVSSVIASNKGQILKFIGDAVVATFKTASAAVQCAVEVQKALAKRNAKKPGEQPILIRIGLHIGEVSVSEGDIFGNGVNIAARLEPLAEPGGICVSQAIVEMLRGRSGVRFESMGRHHLKNIEGEFELFRVATPGQSAIRRPRLPWARLAAGAAAAGLGAAALWWGVPLARRSAGGNDGRFNILLAPLHAETEAAAKESKAMQGIIRSRLNEQFADAPEVTVVSEEEGAAPLSHEQARELGRARGCGLVIWGNTVILSNEIRIQPYLTLINEQAPLGVRNADAFEADIRLPNQLALQAMTANQIGDLALLAAGEYYLDRDGAKAYKLLRSLKAPSVESLTAMAVLASRQSKLEEAVSLTKQALALDPKFATAQSFLGYLYFQDDKFSEALAAAEKAKEMEPTLVWPYVTIAKVRMNAGRHDLAQKELRQALAYSPNSAWPMYTLAVDLFSIKRYEEAVEKFSASTKALPDHPSSYLYLYICLRKLGKDKEAQDLLASSLDRFAGNRYWSSDVLNYYAGKTDKQDFLSLNGDSPFKQARSLYFVGLEDEWAGRRDEADERFQASAKLLKPGSFFRQLAMNELGAL